MGTRGSRTCAVFAAATTILGLALAACGGGAATTQALTSPEQREVVAAANEYRDAVASGDTAAVCELFSQDKLIEKSKELDRVGLASKLCPRALEDEIDSLSTAAARPFSVEGIEFEGKDAAIVEIDTGGEPATWIFTRNKRGAWRFDGGAIEGAGEQPTTDE